MPWWLALIAVGSLLVACSSSSSAPTPASNSATTGPSGGPCGQVATAPRYHHVIWVWMENHGYASIIGSPHAPYINSLARRCGLATNYVALSHPSLPNYIGATSGLARTQLTRFAGDCRPSTACSTAAPSIFGQGETWKAYEESMSSNCAPSNAGDYAVRHNPPPYFRALADCTTNDVPYPTFATDLAGDTLPAFSFVTPNLHHDMHDGTVAEGDAWLARNLPPIFDSPAYRAGTAAVFLTWDEGTGASNRVATIVISPSTGAGTTSAVAFNHYSLLGTAEELLGLPKLGDATVGPTLSAAFEL